MTQIWPGFGEAPVPTDVSMICKPEAVVMVFPVWANAPDGAAVRKPIAPMMAASSESLRKVRYRMVQCPCEWRRGTGGSIAERATVLARVGAAGERALVPVDPDRLAAAERRDHAGGFMPELLQAFDDRGGHAILELIDAFIMQTAWHIDGFLHVAAIVEHVGQNMGLADRLVLAAHHAERHHGAA